MNDRILGSGRGEIRSGDDSVGMNESQGTCQRRGQEQADHRPGEREHQALDEQLLHQAAARGTQRQADSDLALAHERAGDQQVGDVGAGDEQDEPDHAHQHEQGRGEVVAQAGEACRCRFDEQSPLHELLARVGGPVLRGRQRLLVLTDLREEPLQRRLGGVDRVARLQPGEDLDPPGAPIVHVHPRPVRRHHVLHQDRDADLRRLRRIDAGESCRGDTDHGHRVVVDPDRLADDRRIACEPADPVVVAQDDDRVAHGDLIVLPGVEHAAERRLHAEQREVVARHHLRLHALGLVVDADRRRDQPPAQHFRERLRLLLVVLVDGVRVHARPHVAAVVAPLLVQHDQLLGILDRQLPEQHLVDQREDRRIRANPERQGQDGDDGEQRAAAKPPECQSKVREYRSHRALRRKHQLDRWGETVRARVPECCVPVLRARVLASSSVWATSALWHPGTLAPRHLAPWHPAPWHPGTPALCYMCIPRCPRSRPRQVPRLTTSGGSSACCG